LCPGIEQVTGRVAPGKYPVVFVRPLCPGCNYPYWIQPFVPEVGPDGLFSLNPTYFGENNPTITPPGTEFELVIVAANSREEARSFLEGVRVHQLPANLPASVPVIVIRN
jgi:hypothetical protein